MFSASHSLPCDTNCKSKSDSRIQLSQGFVLLGCTSSLILTLSFHYQPHQIKMRFSLAVKLQPEDPSSCLQGRGLVHSDKYKHC